MTGNGTLLNYVNGQWRASRSAELLDVTNPATQEVLARVPLSMAEEVDEAAQAAAAAFPAWRRVPPTERIQYLFRLKTLLEENLDELSRTITQECGKTLEESRGEMRRAIENVEVACGIPTDDAGRLCRRHRQRHRRAHDSPTPRGLRHHLPLQLPRHDSLLVPALRPRLRQHRHRQTFSERVPQTMTRIFELFESLICRRGAESGQRKQGGGGCVAGASAGSGD
jgi:hypothetical protein